MDFTPLSELKLDELPKQKKIIFELVETANEAITEDPDSETNLVSDKSTQARDEYDRLDLQEDAPYSAGDVDTKEPDRNEILKLENEIEPERESIKKLLSELDLTELLKRPEKKIDELFESEESKTNRHNNQLSTVKDYGGLSFNTYDWDFAPYMLAMKRKIQNKIKPPFAFTHMGIISGESVLKFTVDPDGSLREVKVLDSQGHETLTQTSRNAIEWAAPFMPLPQDFPENYLEVTAKFSYTIRK